MMPSFLRLGFCAILLLTGLAVQPAAATVHYDVYQGTGTLGTLLLGFQVPNIIPSTGELIADVIGSEASHFPAGTNASSSTQEFVNIFIPNFSNSIASNTAPDISPIGQYSVGLIVNGSIFTTDATLVVSNTAPNLPVPEPASLALIGTALVGFGALRRRRRKAA